MTAHWTTANISALISEFQKVAIKSTSEGGLKSKEWAAVISEFKAATGCDYDKKQLQSKMNELKADYNLVKTLQDLSGFGWDDRNKVVTASTSVWDSYIASHPKAKKWKTTQFPYFEDLKALFEGNHS